MTLAEEAGADVGPLWLRIVIAAIPSLVGLIGALFALTNTVNRRVERLKNLTEIGREIPRWLDPDYALERVKLRELQAIEQATTPILMWRKRFQVAVWFVVVVGVTFRALQWVHLAPQWQLTGRNLLYGLVVAAVLIGGSALGERANQQFQKRYKRGFDAIDERAEPSGQPSGDDGYANAADDSRDSNVPPDASKT